MKIYYNSLSLIVCNLHLVAILLGSNNVKALTTFLRREQRLEGLWSGEPDSTANKEGLPILDNGIGKPLLLRALKVVICSQAKEQRWQLFFSSFYK